MVNLILGFSGSVSRGFGTLGKPIFRENICEYDFNLTVYFLVIYP